MNNTVGVAHSFEKITGMAEIHQPTHAKLFPWRHSVKAKHLIAVCQQIANDKLP